MEIELKKVDSPPNPLENRRLTLDLESGEKEDNSDVSGKWDYVIQFAGVNPPKNKDGTLVPDDSKAMIRFKEIQQQRRTIVKQLQESSVGLHISRKKSTDGEAVYVLITCSQERLEAQAELVALNMILGEKQGGGRAPFEVAHKHLFVPHSKEHLFRKIERIFLVQSIMEGETEDGGAGLNLDALIRDGIITRLYPLHEKSKLDDLLRNWSHPRNLFRYQPVDEIREYFGEEITIYFAWLGFYTTWLWYATIMGLVVTFFWAVSFFDEKPNAKWTLWSASIYCVFLALWSTAFLEFWKRYNNELAYKWGMEDFVNQERERPDFYGDSMLGVWADGVWVPLNPDVQYGFKLPKPQKYYSIQSRRAKMFSQLPLLATMITMVVILTVSVLSFRLFVQNIQSTLGSVLGGIANAMVIMFMNTLWKMVAIKLNNWENHRTDSEYENSLTIKIFAFYFVNSYTSLFYIAFFKGSGRIFNADVLKDACKSGRTYLVNIGSGCMDELTIQLVTILLVNMFVGQGREVAIPWLVGKINIFLLKRNLKKQSTDEQEDKTIPQWEQEAKKPAFPGTFDEYSEMVIQYGYITLFAASFPLAPFLAVLNNMIEIRTDAFKLLAAHSRPEYKGAQGIGAWYAILNFLGIISVITNCLLIGYSLDSVADIFGSVPHNTSARRISQVPYYTFVVIVVLEHILFGMKAGLAFVIPDVPGWIVKDRARQNWVKEMTLRQLNKPEKKEWRDTIHYADDEKDQVSI